MHMVRQASGLCHKQNEAKKHKTHVRAQTEPRNEGWCQQRYGRQQLDPLEQREHDQNLQKTEEEETWEGQGGHHEKRGVVNLEVRLRYVLVRGGEGLGVRGQKRIGDLVNAVAGVDEEGDAQLLGETRGRLKR